MKPVRLRPQADADLDGLTEYYAAMVGTELAYRFLDCVESTLRQISQYPASGSPVRPDIDRLEGLRYVPVHGFPRILIFYKDAEDHLDVGRVIHGFRDLDEALRS